jgi:cell fate regulator YaaT (PSP1 superfamily)
MYSVARIIVPDLGCTSCAVPVDIPLVAGDRCVFELDHVHELGTIRELAVQETPPTAERGVGSVLRKLTEDDLARDETNREVAAKALAAFRGYVGENHIPTRPMKAHFSFRREKLTLWYASDESIDLRQVIGHLQRQFSTKVDARQIGVRDEAAMIGGCGGCGRPLCCATWLRNFHSVNIRMARAQEISMTPGAVNGMCGRLKCCLRYEYDQYQESSTGMPPVGVIVSWADGEGVVVSRDIMARKVTVRADNRFVVVAVADLHPSLQAGATANPPERGDEEGDTHGIRHEDTDR